MAKWKLDENNYPQSLSKAQKIIASQREVIDNLAKELAGCCGCKRKDGQA